MGAENALKVQFVECLQLRICPGLTQSPGKTEHDQRMERGKGYLHIETEIVDGDRRFIGRGDGKAVAEQPSCSGSQTSPPILFFDGDVRHKHPPCVQDQLKFQKRNSIVIASALEQTRFGLKMCGWSETPVTSPQFSSA